MTIKTLLATISTLGNRSSLASRQIRESASVSDFHVQPGLAVLNRYHWRAEVSHELRQELRQNRSQTNTISVTHFHNKISKRVM